MDERDQPTHLDLFSGIGGFALAAQWAGFRTIGFCEIDKYCRKVLAKNFGPFASSNNAILFSNRQGISQESGSSKESGNFPVLISDIFGLDGTKFRGVDLITGGFPCQPFSVAGKRRGTADHRAIWPEMFRVIDEARPAWVLGENVPGIIPMELDNVLSDLEGIGYATRTFVIPACAVDARHRRDRLWIIGRNVSDSNGQGSQGRDGEELRERSGERVVGAGDSSMSDTQHQQFNGTGGARNRRPESSNCCIWPDESKWFPQSPIRRVAHGIPSRMDRLKGLGNAIVSQVAYEILREIRRANQLDDVTLNPLQMRYV